MLQVLWFGGDINYIGDMDYAAIHYAARYGDVLSITCLLENDAKLWDNTYRWSPLNLAKQFGRKEVVDALADAGMVVEPFLDE